MQCTHLAQPETYFMYHILDRSAERVGDHICVSQNVIPKHGISANAIIVLQMQQNRSSFPQEGRPLIKLLGECSDRVRIFQELYNNLI